MDRKWIGTQNTESDDVGRQMLKETELKNAEEKMVGIKRLMWKIRRRCKRRDRK